EDRDRRRARVHPTLALGDRYALHPVRSGFVLESSPGVRALHDEGDVAVATHLGRLAREHFEIPPAQLGVPAGHLEEISRPEVRLVAAFGTPDLHDDVLAVVGIARDEQLSERRLELGDASFPLSQLALEVLAHLGVLLALEQLARVRDVRFGPAV